ncbi:hypothetical protein M405DRAFT_917783 [Rhizopogon salebrosus TDB-379]|nr:hypothetical protein M405DRAFT_917783 [Rhizopogon salebrosus TDB-379]
MYRHTIASTSYLSTSSYLIADNFSENIATSVLAEGLAKAHGAVHILFVVQPNKRNMFDQRWLEYELFEKHEVHNTRQTLAELAISLNHPTTHEVFVYFHASYTPSEFPAPRTTTPVSSHSVFAP